ncbi:MAG: rubrerythrin family protein [Firmicutes bacterium]|nr:rubrerythrin family protein [Bacillota bacterium]
MGKNLKGTKTERNLWEAFAGESQARNKYSFFASTAKKEGYEQISAIFTETAENEKEHAKLHFKFLEGIGDTAENLRAAAAGENEEWTEMYPRMAKEAREEGFDEIAAVFEGLIEIEKDHERRFQKLLKNMEDGTVFQKDETVTWHCRNCGYLHKNTEAPEICPVCDHPRAHFEIHSTNY